MPRRAVQYFPRNLPWHLLGSLRGLWALSTHLSDTKRSSHNQSFIRGGDASDTIDTIREMRNWRRLSALCLLAVDRSRNPSRAREASSPWLTQQSTASDWDLIQNRRFINSMENETDLSSWTKAVLGFVLLVVRNRRAILVSLSLSLSRCFRRLGIRRRSFLIFFV